MCSKRSEHHKHTKNKEKGIGMKKTLSVRIEPELHKKVYADENKNAYIVTKALNQFYRRKEPNQKLFADTNTNTNMDKQILDIMKEQIDFLKGQVTFLQKENIRLSGGFFYKAKNLLNAKKEGKN